MNSFLIINIISFIAFNSVFLIVNSINLIHISIKYSGTSKSLSSLSRNYTAKIKQTSVITIEVTIRIFLIIFISVNFFFFFLLLSFNRLSIFPIALHDFDRKIAPMLRHFRFRTTLFNQSEWIYTFVSLCYFLLSLSFLPRSLLSVLLVRSRLKTTRL